MKIHPYPASSTLRQAQPWQPIPRPPACLRRIAVHEAGHIVLMQWAGLEPPLATVTRHGEGMRGAAHWPAQESFAHLPAEPLDESGELGATAAAVFHAGVMAELLAFGLQWVGPIHYPLATDYTSANDMLRGRFGNHASGAHAFAQRVALHVLSGRWAEVEAVAAELEATGTWIP